MLKARWSQFTGVVGPCGVLDLFVKRFPWDGDEAQLSRDCVSFVTDSVCNPSNRRRGSISVDHESTPRMFDPSGVHENQRAMDNDIPVVQTGLQNAGRGPQLWIEGFEGFKNPFRVSGRHGRYLNASPFQNNSRLSWPQPRLCGSADMHALMGFGYFHFLLSSHPFQQIEQSEGPPIPGKNHDRLSVFQFVRQGFKKGHVSIGGNGDHDQVCTGYRVAHIGRHFLELCKARPSSRLA